MPVATSVDLEKFTQFAKPLVESGRYTNANAVLMATMDALIRAAEEEAKHAWLLAAIEEGEASGSLRATSLTTSACGTGFPRTSVDELASFCACSEGDGCDFFHTLQNWGSEQALNYLDELAS